MRISSQHLLYIVSGIADDAELTTIEDLIEYLEQVNSVYEIQEV
jgi:hypothetical protein